MRADQCCGDSCHGSGAMIVPRWLVQSPGNCAGQAELYQGWRQWMPIFSLPLSLDHAGRKERKHRDDLAVIIGIMLAEEA
jgi:hypothetical protein